MKRRDAIMGLSALPFASLAQQGQRLQRIGFLGAASAAGFASQIAGLRTGLKELGYIEGRTLVIEFRWAEGKLERLPVLAKDLVSRGVEVLVTQGTPATRAAKAATSSIPIVMAAVGDAIVTGIVTSLARPGGNVTGMTFFSSELVAKRVEILKSALPGAKRIGIMVNPDNPIQGAPLAKHVSGVAMSLNVEIDTVSARSLVELESAIDTFAAKRNDAVVFIEEPLQLVNATKLTGLAARHRLATIGPLEFVSAGAVLAYGVHFPELYRRSAFFVDKILKGAKPADLPVEQATRFELVINVKSAKAIGLAIPASLVPRADRVLE